MMQRTTVKAHPDDLATLRAEARRRGESMATLMERILRETAAGIRDRRAPRFAVGASGGGIAADSVRDEDAPAATDPRS